MSFERHQLTVNLLLPKHHHLMDRQRCAPRSMAHTHVGTNSFESLSGDLALWQLLAQGRGSGEIESLGHSWPLQAPIQIKRRSQSGYGKEGYATVT